MFKKGIIRKNRVFCIFMVLIMVLSGFIAMAGSAQENDSNENEISGAIIGTVLAGDGNPLEGVIVYLTKAGESTVTEEDPFRQKTNENGYFEFADLSRGVYALEVDEAGFHRWSLEVKVPAGEKVEVKVVLKKIEEPTKYGHVFGWVYNALEEEPIPGAFIEIFNERSDERPITTKTDRKGHFEVRVPRGKYTLVANSEGFEPYKEQLVVKGGDEVELKILLKPYVEQERPSLCGHIFDAKTDKPIFGWVELSYSDPKLKTSMPEPIKEFKERKDDREDEDCDSDKNQERECKEREDKERKEEKENTRSNNNDGKDPEPERCDKKLTEVQCEKPVDFFLWRTYSNQEGFYEYFNVPPGHYEMRVFAKGHITYYNEINIGEEPLFIDVYLLRAKSSQKPYSIISGHVFKARTNEPIAGAVVCVIPTKMVRKVLQELKTQDLDLGNIDLDNIDLSSDLEATYSDLPEDEPNLNLKNDDEVIREDRDYIDIPNPREEKTPNSRSSNERDKDCPEPKLRRQLLRKFCTKTDECGNFKLKVLPGDYVLIVKARGYELFARKFEIKPYQKMVVKVSLKPEDNQALDTDEGANTKNSEGSSTLDMLSGMPASSGATTSILSAVLSILIIIAVILGAALWQRKKNGGSRNSNN